MFEIYNLKLRDYHKYKYTEMFKIYITFYIWRYITKYKN